jgi:hypothetical protein
VHEDKAKSREIKGRCAKLFALGYQVLPIAPGAKYPALFENGGWVPHGIGELQRRYPANDQRCAEWDGWGASAGIHFNGTGICGLDIDSLDPLVSRMIQRIAEEHCDFTMSRFGRRPKAMMFYRCDPRLTYRRWTLDADNKVELLAGVNRMAVMLGKHPDTGQPYEIEPTLLAPGQLPIVDTWQLDVLFEALTAAFPGSYVSTPGEEHGDDPERAKAISKAIRRLNDAVLAMPVSELAAGRFNAALASDERLAKLWRQGSKDRDDSQSGLIYTLAQALRQRGFSLEEYARLVMSWPRITHQASCRTPRALARAWVNSMPKAAAFNEADWFEPSEPEPVTGFFRPYRWPVEAKHPRRDFIYGSTYQRRLVGATYAGTKVGKTSLLVTEALAMASGKPLLGLSPKGINRVALWNGEDDLDELERLVMGALRHHGLTSADVGDRLILESGHDAPLRLVNEMGVPVPDAFKRIVDNIRHHHADVLILDPLISLTGGQETNAALDAVGKELGRIAAITRSAIHIAHHIRKPGQLRSATSLEDGRGGGSLTAAVRSARAISAMTAAEAGKCGIDPRQAARYFRVTDAATNTAPPPMADDFWFFKQSVRIDNGDEIGVATLASLRYGVQPGDDTPEPWRAQVLKELEPPARWRVDVQSADWAGRAVAKHAGLDPDEPGDRAVIKLTLSKWRRWGLIEEQVAQVDRKPKRFLVSVVAQPND